MKKYLSVGMLYARKSVYKLLATILFCVIAESVVYSIYHDSHYFMLLNGRTITGILFVRSFVLFTVLLYYDAFRDKSVSGYTLQRLQISEFKAFICQSAVYMMCYLALYCRWLIIISVLCLVYTKISDLNPAIWRIYYEFLNDITLHNIVPLGDVYGFIRNISAMIVLGIDTAAIDVLHRYDKWTFGSLAVLGILFIAFSRFRTIAETVIMIAFVAWTAFFSIIRVRNAAHNGQER